MSDQEYWYELHRRTMTTARMPMSVYLERRLARHEAYGDGI